MMVPRNYNNEKHKSQAKKIQMKSELVSHLETKFE